MMNLPLLDFATGRLQGARRTHAGPATPLVPGLDPGPYQEPESVALILNLMGGSVGLARALLSCSRVLISSF